MSIDWELTALWRELTVDRGPETQKDIIELLPDGFFLNVDGMEFDALGDTAIDAEQELHRAAATPDLEMEWDYHFMRGTLLLMQVESFAEDMYP